MKTIRDYINDAPPEDLLRLFYNMQRLITLLKYQALSEFYEREPDVKEMFKALDGNERKYELEWIFTLSPFAIFFNEWLNLKYESTDDKPWYSFDVILDLFNEFLIEKTLVNKQECGEKL